MSTRCFCPQLIITKKAGLETGAKTHLPRVLLPQRVRTTAFRSKDIRRSTPLPHPQIFRVLHTHHTRLSRPAPPPIAMTTPQPTVVIDPARYRTKQATLTTIPRLVQYGALHECLTHTHPARHTLYAFLIYPLTFKLFLRCVR